MLGIKTIALQWKTTELIKLSILIWVVNQVMPLYKLTYEASTKLEKILANWVSARNAYGPQ